MGGRFDFDTLSSIALFSDGLVEVATESAGWYQLPREDPSVRYMMRRRIPGVGAFDVREVGLTRASGAMHLVLRTFADDIIRLSPAGVPERIEVFSEHAADDGLWQYRRNGGALEIASSASTGGAATRRMVAGRFEDDVVTGWPLTLGNGEARQLWLPTRAGLQLLDDALAPVSIRVGPFTGLAPDAVPAILFAREGQVLYAGRDAFYAFANGEPIEPLRLDRPDDSMLTDIAPARGGAWRLSWRAGAQRGWHRLRGADLGAFPANTRYIDVAGLDKFQENRIAFGDPSPWLLAELADNRLRLRLEDVPGELELPLPRGFQPIAEVTTGRHLLLFGARHLFEVELEQVLAELFAGQTAGQRLTRTGDNPTASGVAGHFGDVIQSPVSSWTKKPAEQP